MTDQGDLYPVGEGQVFVVTSGHIINNECPEPVRRIVIPTSQPVSLISRWFLKPERYKDAMPVLLQLAETVLANEPDTLTYLVHTHFKGDLESLPPADGLSILFFETYRNAAAFNAHVTGPDFTDFVRDHGDLFVAGNDGKPYTTVEFLTRHAGFVRP